MTIANAMRACFFFGAAASALTENWAALIWVLVAVLQHERAEDLNRDWRED